GTVRPGPSLLLPGEEAGRGWQRDQSAAPAAIRPPAAQLAAAAGGRSPLTLLGKLCTGCCAEAIDRRDHEDWVQRSGIEGRMAPRWSAPRLVAARSLLTTRSSRRAQAVGVGLDRD